jgi:xanthine dehydrogenase YagS FAD-binding subunit
MSKRTPGSGCSAIEGFSRAHAILGASDACIATHPSDMAVVMTVLEARIELLDADQRTRSRTLAQAAQVG